MKRFLEMSPAAGLDADRFDRVELAAVGHRLAMGDVDWREGLGREAEGRVRREHDRSVNIDANVELTLRDPRPRR